MMPSPCTRVTRSPSTPTSSLASAPDWPRCTKTSLRHCTWRFSSSRGGSAEASEPARRRRRTTTLRRIRHVSGRGPWGRWRSSSHVSVRTQPSRGKGVRKPREPAAKESTGGMASRNSETAHVSVPSPPRVMTRSMDLSSLSAREKVRARCRLVLRSGWSASSCGSRTTTMPCEDSQATMSWRVATTSGSPGFATTSTARGLPFHCITRCRAPLDSILRPSRTTMGLPPAIPKSPTPRIWGATQRRPPPAASPNSTGSPPPPSQATGVERRARGSCGGRSGLR
mmetsp:Transcript_59991/g.186084  ORF Transcript_59991/g.186084 Transcript_59991/m.186084 type:complete len:283 (+) Transcript_59991:455-1303(+)